VQSDVRSRLSGLVDSYCEVGFRRLYSLML